MPSLRNTDKAFRYPIIISGCSGGGKSTLVRELSRRGYATFEEAGRRVVADELCQGGDGFPWQDFERFCRLSAEYAKSDFLAASAHWESTFLDRSIFDLLFNLRAVGAVVPPTITEFAQFELYHPVVFLAPPWENIYVDDGVRNKSFQAASEEFELLESGYGALGFVIELLPKLNVHQRADFIEQKLLAVSSPSTGQS